MDDEAGIDLSVIVCTFDMERELPRTVFTLSREYQRGIEDIEFEILIIDNGSPNPIDASAMRQIEPRAKVLRFAPGNPSPLKAINAAAAQAKGRIIGLLIDGARMASPGIYRKAIDAHQTCPDQAIGTIGMHLGPDVQMRSILTGYDQTTEDALLDSIPWRADGYRLFEISVLAGSSAEGWFRPITESNAVFMDRSRWDALGGLDERFRQPGGGLANLDFWSRAVANADPWIMLGEATFHQVHGGVATSGSEEARHEMFAEYAALMGKPFVTPDYEARYIGSLAPGLSNLVDRTASDRKQRRGIPKL